MKKAFKGELILLFTALVWGFAFVAQSKGMEHIGPFSFNVFRFLLGGISIFIFLLVRWFLTKKEERKPLLTKQSIIGGTIISFLSYLLTGCIYEKGEAPVIGSFLYTFNYALITFSFYGISILIKNTIIATVIYLILYIMVCVFLSNLRSKTINF